ncbi:MAG: hypothetical protein OEZ65_00220 [Gemmatimonadota bacterium]|nr:hypothetical protein [Gemmatimonadota bacterium]
MFRSVLYVHWKQVHLGLIPLMVAAFSLPLLSVQGLGGNGGVTSFNDTSLAIIQGLQVWLPFFSALAAASGVVIALSSWNWDHQLNHVYALSLPVPRWRYALMKMGAGAVLTLFPAVALWVGAHLAAASIVLPEGLHAYPNALAIRFLATILLTYAILFAMAAGTVRTTMWVTGTGILTLFILGLIGNDLLAGQFEVLRGTHILEWALAKLDWVPGPLEIFLGNWRLIDV